MHYNFQELWFGATIMPIWHKNLNFLKSFSKHFYFYEVRRKKSFQFLSSSFYLSQVPNFYLLVWILKHNFWNFSSNFHSSANVWLQIGQADRNIDLISGPKGQQCISDGHMALKNFQSPLLDFEHYRSLCCTFFSRLGSWTPLRNWGTLEYLYSINEADHWPSLMSITSGQV